MPNDCNIKEVDFKILISAEVVSKPN